MLKKDTKVTITVDEQNCISCGQCVNICFDHLKMVDNKVVVNEHSTFGCIQCGNCMMLCPKECIYIDGNAISQDKINPLVGHKPHIDDLFYMLKKRRSIRQFKDIPVEQSMIEKIIEAGTTAPVALPPSEVQLLVFNGKEKVQAFADELCESIEKMVKFFNPLVLTAFKPIMGPVQYELFKDFVIPIYKQTVEKRKEGIDILFYNAPAVIVLYVSKYAVPEDAIIASTYCQIAANNLGLGTCVIGVAPCMDKCKILRAKYGLIKTDTVGTAFILGHPLKEFNRSVKREFMSVKYI